MARKQKFDYFQAFIQLSEYAVEYSTELVKYFEKNRDIAREGRDPDIEHAIKRFDELHKIETAADTVKHGIISNLVTEFITPLEREDIITLASELDDLVDDLDEVLQRMYMYDVHVVPQPVVDMMRLAQQECLALNELCQEFVNYKKSTSLREQVIRLNDLEEEADRLYTTTMHDVFSHMAQARERMIKDGNPPTDDVLERMGFARGPVYAFGVSKLMDEIERICDMCESVADTIITVVMKNT